MCKSVFSCSVTLSRRMAFFGIPYTKYDTLAEEVERAVAEELEGPGQLLGYRAMHKRLREHHNLAVPRNLVYDVMTKLDPEGLERRGNVGKKKRRRGATRTFTSLGPNHTHSGDGHDKLMGFQNNTFPLAVYALQDVFSGFILFIKLWTSNSDPKLVGKWYLEHLYETKVVSHHLRLDRGSETGDLAAIHAFLIQDVADEVNGVNTVHYGSSTNNKIERWWRDLHQRMDKFFKRQLSMLLEQGHYDPCSQTDRALLSFVFIPLIEKEMKIFVGTWNTHRVRCQKDAQVPKGVPAHLYNFPDKYNAEQCGFPVTKQLLDEVAEYSQVMESNNDFLPQPIRDECERIVPRIDDLKPQDAAITYIFLKTHYKEPST